MGLQGSLGLTGWELQVPGCFGAASPLRGPGFWSPSTMVTSVKRVRLERACVHGRRADLEALVPWETWDVKTCAS